MATRLFSPRRHSSESWNPGGEAAVMNGWQVLPDGALVIIPLVVIPALREWLVSTTGFQPALE